MENLKEKSDTIQKPNSKIENIVDNNADNQEVVLGEVLENKQNRKSIEKNLEDFKKKELVEIHSLDDGFEDHIEYDLNQIVEDKNKIENLNNKINNVNLDIESLRKKDHIIRSEVKGVINYLKNYNELEDFKKYDSNKDELSYFDAVFPDGYKQLGDIIPEDKEVGNEIPILREQFRLAEKKVELIENNIHLLNELKSRLENRINILEEEDNINLSEESGMREAA